MGLRLGNIKRDYHVFERRLSIMDKFSLYEHSSDAKKCQGSVDTELKRWPVYITYVIKLQ